MPTISETTVFDTFFTATIKNYTTDQLMKNFLEYWAGLKLFFDDNKHTDTSGGRLKEGSAAYGLNQTTKFWDGADTFDQNPAQTAVPYTYQWRYLGTNVSFTKTEMLENRGKVALFNITQSRIEQAIRTMNLICGQELYSDGTNYNGKTFIGLGAMISTTPSSDPASGAVGGIPVASFPFWQNNATTSAGSFAANGVNGSSDDVVIRMFNTCSDGARVPDGILSAQDVWEFYNRSLLKTVHIYDPSHSKTGDLTFKTLDYMGIPWMWDRLCPSGRMYLVNKKDMHFTVDPAYLFEWSPALTYPTQLAYNRICGLRFLFEASARMFSGVIDGFSA